MRFYVCSVLSASQGKSLDQALIREPANIASQITHLHTQRERETLRQEKENERKAND